MHRVIIVQILTYPSRKMIYRPLKTRICPWISLKMSLALLWESGRDGFHSEKTQFWTWCGCWQGIKGCEFQLRFHYVGWSRATEVESFSSHTNNYKSNLPLSGAVTVFACLQITWTGTRWTTCGILNSAFALIGSSFIWSKTMNIFILLPILPTVSMN